MNIFGKPVRARAGIALAAMVALAACQDDNNDAGLLLSPDAIAEAGVQGSFVASNLTAGSGEDVTIALKTANLEGVTFGGLQGTLLYDARLLELKGQVADNGTMVVINDDDPGAIRMQALNVRGLGEQPAIFTFAVKGAGWADGLDFAVEHYVDLDMVEYDLRFDRGDVRPGDLPEAVKGKPMGFESWLAYLDPSLTVEDWYGKDGFAKAVSSGGQGDSPTGSTTYGDTNGDGNVNVLDNLYAANVSVGNTGQAECIIEVGPSLVGDCIAANVSPTNDGPGGATLPGLEASGARIINVLDGLELGLASTTGGRPVAGQPMVLAGAPAGTVNLCAGFSGGQRVVTGTLDLSADTLYVLDNCRVSIGDEAGAAGVINIEAGTRIEGTDSSSLDVNRNGQIFALGTALEPVVFTCVDDGPTPGLREAGCWGGVQVTGSAVINIGDAGTAPAIAGRNPAGGGDQSGLEGFLPADLFYGGANDADNSGILRHVIVAYGGRSVAPNNELNNLTLGALGSGTTLEYIQTHAGTDDGLEIFGGRANVKGLISTLNDDDQFDLSFGYDGASQFVFIRSQVDGSAPLNTDNGLEWDGNETAVEYGIATPATTPVVWNLTAVAGDGTTPQEKFANIRRGAGGDLNNFLVVGYASGLDVDEVASCDRLGISASPGTANNTWSGTAPDHGLTFAGAFLGVSAATSECTNTAGDATPVADHLAAQAGAGLYGTAAIAGQLKNAFDITAWDIRPLAPDAGTGVTTQTPPATGFFDTSANYLGAAPPTSLGAGAIPFYAGWAITAQSSTQR